LLVIIGKEKYDLQRRPKTGGGPPSVFSAAEEIMVDQLTSGNKAELTGLPSGQTKIFDSNKEFYDSFQGMKFISK
jgi:hypothetical protein